MNYVEQATSFHCAGEQLLGILSRPDLPGATGVVVIVGGPQYRVGSHRQFVLLARALAARGYPVLRFDYRGMGDSEGRQRDFEAVSADVGAAVDALCSAVPAVQRVVLWGLCDGASAALLYLDENQDPRVQGLCLLNPWVRSAASLARTQVKHYYFERIAQKEFWRKLLRGQIAGAALRGLVQNLRTAFARQHAGGKPAELPFQARMARSWAAFKLPILLLLSEADYTAKEFMDFVQADAHWQGALAHPLLQQHVLAGADHTCSSMAWRSLVEAQMLDWLKNSMASGHR